MMGAVQRISPSNGGHGLNVSAGSQLTTPRDTEQFFGAIALQMTFEQASMLGEKLRVRYTPHRMLSLMLSVTLSLS